MRSRKSGWLGSKKRRRWEKKLSDLSHPWLGDLFVWEIHRLVHEADLRSLWNGSHTFSPKEGRQTRFPSFTCTFGRHREFGCEPKTGRRWAVGKIDTSRALSRLKCQVADVGGAEKISNQALHASVALDTRWIHFWEAALITSTSFL